MNQVATIAEENEWTTVRLKTLLMSAKNGVWGAEPRGDGSDTLCIRVADFDRDKLTVIERPTTYRYVEKKDLQGRTVRTGDLLLEKSGGGEKTLVGMAVRYRGNEAAVCSNFVSVVRPREGVSSNWLNYLFFSLYSRRINYRSIKQSTGIQNLDAGSYFDERVPVPGSQTQVAIATALDRETARIDALIEKKTRFIELLKEKRQALITKAVTKGLDPMVPMKDSGVKWIGEVPAHWNVRKIAHLTPVKRGASPRPIDDPRYFDNDGEFGWVRIQDVTSCGGTLRSTQQLLSALGSSKSVKMEPGKLFLSIAATVGVPCIAEIKCCIHDGFVYFPNLQLPPAWLYRIFESRECFVGLGKMGTQLNLNTETVGGISVPIPPPNEMDRILESLSNSTTGIDKLMEKSMKSIDLLKERRSALITAAVTGQIDLREDAA